MTKQADEERKEVAMPVGKNAVSRALKAVKR